MTFKLKPIPSSEITPRGVYMRRREFLGGALATAVFGGLTAGAAAAPLAFSKSTFSTNEPLTPKADVTSYNNFYEFGTHKTDPSSYASALKTSPCHQNRWAGVEARDVYARRYPETCRLEERIYRHRCVEGWSIVVPWIGYSLSALLNLVQPTAKARYVAFESYWDLKQMPLARPSVAGIEFPYVEGLRLDEAMHPLALLSVGMYGETLPPQDGAPVRLVVPWKYGFKSAKSLVKIRLVSSQPPTTWNMANAHEYGFYSNVNPQVDHPRWSQKTERRIGDGNGLFAKRGRRFRSTATAIRSRAFTPAWT